MPRPKILLKQITSLIVALVISTATPVAVYADASDGSSSGSTGTSQPTGVAASTYHYNENTGLWENDHYTWNPTTKVTSPKDDQIYIYNPSTKLWDAQVWQYHTVQGVYTLDAISITDPPTGSQTQGGPQPVVNSTPSSTDPIVASANSQSQPTESTGGSSYNSAGTVSVSQGTSVTNNASSNATSGNAQAANNTTVGNVSTGSATTSVNVINMIQSSTALANPNVAVFQTNIQGDVTGDLLIDPASLPQSSSMDQSSLNNLTLNSTQNNSIQNNLYLASTSGNALTDNNRTAGDITTGNAAAVANVMNMINSVVAANQSFYGVINIYGNYTGNILVPTDTLSSLLASNAGSTQSSNQVGSTTTTDTTTNNSITTNLDLAALSGSATASGNRTVGDVTTGNAMTNVTILNLTGHQVTAANSLLVFVNVLGTWVGVIMDAPAGATAAALTGGATTAATSAAMNGTLAADATANTAYTSSTNNSITNNITASATSGNATAHNNTTAGNVRTGDASVSANIANLVHSNFSLSQWFGVLFINVYGMWHGNFGTTDRSSPSTGGMGSGGSMPAVASAAASDATSKLFRFDSNSDSSRTLGLTPIATTSTPDAENTASSVISNTANVLAATTTKPITQSANVQQTGLDISIAPIIIGALGLLAILVERYRRLHKQTS